MSFFEFPSLPEGVEYLCGDNNEFARNTIKSRVPVIIREAREQAQKACKDCPGCDPRLTSRLLDNLLQSIEMNEVPRVCGEDEEIWNNLSLNFEREGKDLLSIPWLFAECLLYRKIQDACVLSCSENNPADLFFNLHKKDAHTAAGEYTMFLAKASNEYFYSTPPMSDRNVGVIGTFMRFSLWGNRVDLSLIRNKDDISEVNCSLPLSLNSLALLENQVVLNDLDIAVEYTSKLKGKRVDIILDNSGTELFSDIALADVILTYGASEVILHVKNFPWFVSDATKKDVYFLLDSLKSSGNEDFSKFASRCLDNIHSGRLNLSENRFWTLPYPYSNFCNDIENIWTESLAKSSLLVFKGDLNYRKLFSDAKWPTNTPLEFALSYMYKLKDRPAILSLRICKAPISVGVDTNSHEMCARDPDWNCKGKLAMVVFVPPANS